MATCTTVYRSPDAVPKVVGDTIRLVDHRLWTVESVLENRECGDQLLRMEIPDEDLLTCSRS